MVYIRTIFNISEIIKKTEIGCWPCVYGHERPKFYENVLVKFLALKIEI
ncbi:hypothetical protein LV92_03725 [Arenibacter echinorum]|uniref:Uncharacterized protein n=1 Tax=Arenibacter echinorum TaxID=440515 RepID=A0A327QV33_9FLAO|nr:hypothetical protein LV92_03725 [Arenibacter echinorum]